MTVSDPVPVKAVVDFVETRQDLDAVTGDHAVVLVRADGHALISGNYVVKGVEALAAPVFNFRNEISMAMLIVAGARMRHIGAVVGRSRFALVPH